MGDMGERERERGQKSEKMGDVIYGRTQSRKEWANIEFIIFIDILF